MKTLSIKQPWASLIASGIKDIENRTWKTSYRGRIYIHASGSQPKGFYNILGEERFNAFHEHEESCRFAMELALGHKWLAGAIIGEVDIIDCVLNSQSIWADPQNDPIKNIWHWVLANPVMYDEPILNIKGRLSLWEYEREYQVIGTAEIISPNYGPPTSLELSFERAGLTKQEWGGNNG